MKERRHIVLNLVRRRREQRRRLERITREVFWSCVFVLSGLILYVLYSSIHIYSLQGDRRELEAKVEELTPLVRHVDSLQKEIDSLSPLVQSIQTYRMDVLQWEGLFWGLGNLLPPGVWLVSVVFSPLDEKSLKVDLNGRALNYSQVGELMMRIQASGNYQDVSLKSSGLTSVGGRDIVQFQLELKTQPLGGGRT